MYMCIYIYIYREREIETIHNMYKQINKKTYIYICIEREREIERDVHSRHWPR